MNFVYLDIFRFIFSLSIVIFFSIVSIDFGVLIFFSLHRVDIPEGSNLFERTFETVVVPDSSDLAAQKYGWIKDPAGNYIRIDLSNVVRQNIIPSCLIISRICGFVEPQRVILCYQILDNQFNMRIVDDAGLDVTYYGFHFPTNHHARKVADPFYYPPSPPPLSFISAVQSRNEDEEVGLAIPAEMFNTMVVDNGGNVAVEARLNIPNPDLPIHIPGGDGVAEEYIWTLKVTQPIADGRSVLHFPRFVIENFTFSVGPEIHVMDDATGEMFTCMIKTANTPSGYVVKYLARGWYQFVRSKELSVGDHIVFGVQNPVKSIDKLLLSH
ncbi:putative transcription factor B3-Domain family [Medicago truncatula]|uniref:Putative transcription factor B3-Domain family n=1 Tax=Medicago truncatula TaxID=3880 RepID=A0A396GD01_MEDTR|nr:putative transcription factor B3-Domain family [Medicago truncatula]